MKAPYLTLLGHKPAGSKVTTIIRYTKVCAWCDKVIEKGHDKLVSHGMCDQCEENWDTGSPQPAA